MEKRGDPFTRFVDVPHDLSAERVHTGRIPVERIEKRQHRVPDFGGDARCRIVVEIDRVHLFLIFLKKMFIIAKKSRRVEFRISVPACRMGCFVAQDY